jgi:hypothetical protein
MKREPQNDSASARRRLMGRRNSAERGGATDSPGWRPGLLDAATLRLREVGASGAPMRCCGTPRAISLLLCCGHAKLIFDRRVRARGEIALFRILELRVFSEDVS